MLAHLSRRSPRLSKGRWALLASALALAACAPAPPTSSAPPAPRAEPAARPAATASAIPTAPARQLVKVGLLPTIGSAPFYIGLARGYYEQEGIELEAVPIASGAETVPPLASGQLDVVTVAPSAGLVNAIARGLPVKMVASNGTLRPGRNIANIVVRRDLAPDGALTDLAALPRPVRAGATVEGILPHAVLLLQFERAGVPPDAVSMHFMGLPDLNVALANGSLDVAASGEPLITIGEQQGILTRWREMAELHPNMPYAVLLYGVNLLERDRDAGERLMRGYLRAARDYEDAFARGRDREAIVALLAEPLRMTPALFDALQARGGLAYLDPNGELDVETFRPILEFWARTRLGPAGFEPSRLADPHFAAAAVARLGRYE